MVVWRGMGGGFVGAHSMGASPRRGHAAAAPQRVTCLRPFLRLHRLDADVGMVMGAARASAGASSLQRGHLCAGGGAALQGRHPEQAGVAPVVMLSMWYHVGTAKGCSPGAHMPSITTGNTPAAAGGGGAAGWRHAMHPLPSLPVPTALPPPPPPRACRLPHEDPEAVYPPNLAPPEQILIDASNGEWAGGGGT